MRFLKIFAIIFIGLFINTNAYSKAFKTRVIFESEYGGIYSFKNSIVSQPKGRADTKVPSQAQLSSLLECYQTGQYGDAEKLAAFITQAPRKDKNQYISGGLYLLDF